MALRRHKFRALFAPIVYNGPRFVAPGIGLARAVERAIQSLGAAQLLECLPRHRNFQVAFATGQDAFVHHGPGSEETRPRATLRRF